MTKLMESVFDPYVDKISMNNFYIIVSKNDDTTWSGSISNVIIETLDGKILEANDVKNIASKVSTDIATSQPNFTSSSTIRYSINRETINPLNALNGLMSRSTAIGIFFEQTHIIKKITFNVITSSKVGWLCVGYGSQLEHAQINDDLFVDTTDNSYLRPKHIVYENRTPMSGTTNIVISLYPDKPKADKPHVTADDDKNIINGLTTAMEYSFDAVTWTKYDGVTHPDLADKKATVYVRVAETDTHMPSDYVVLKFTTNSSYIRTTKSGDISLDIRGLGEVILTYNGTHYKKVIDPWVGKIKIPLPNDSTEKTIKMYHNDNVTAIYALNQDITNVSFVGFSSLNKVIMYDNNLSDINIKNCPEISDIHIHNNPICNSYDILKELADSLPDRRSKGFGSIILDSKEIELRLEEEVCLDKDWMFGSTIMYDKMKRNKLPYALFEDGIARIWETAEYGEGVKLHIVDSAFDVNAVEFNKAHFLGGINLELSTGDENNLAPGNKHGTQVTSCAIAQGVNIYGTAPKASYWLTKIGTEGGGADNNILLKGLTYSEDKDDFADIVNMSYYAKGAAYVQAEQDKIANFFLNSNGGRGTPMFICLGNSGDGNHATHEWSYPACYETVMSVNAVNINYEIPLWGQSSNYNDMCEFGVDIPVNVSGNQMGKNAGTSFATPYTSGIACLLFNILRKKLKRKPHSTELYKEVFKRTRDIGQHFDHQGIGKIDLKAFNPNYEHALSLLMGKYYTGSHFMKISNKSSLIMTITTKEDGLVVFESEGINFRFNTLANTPKRITIGFSDATITNVVNMVSGGDIITEIIANQQSISELNLTGLSELKKLHIYGNPICNFPTELDKMVSTLPDRRQKGYGSIVIDNKTQSNRLEKVTLKRDWCFGSMLQYTNGDKIPWTLKVLGIPDIWETADYGAGVNICVTDTMFDLASTEVDVTKIHSRHNFSGNNDPDDDVTGDLKSTHGTMVLSTIMSKGVRMYGAAYQANFHLVRLNSTNEKGESNASGYGLSKASSSTFLANNYDVFTASFGGADDYTANIEFYKSVFDTNNGSGLPMFYSSANFADGNAATIEPRQYPASFKGVVSVSAIDKHDRIASFARAYDKIDLVSYGVDVPVCNVGQNIYGEVDGTSFSCPLTAGVTALLHNILKKKLGRKPNVWEVYEELFKRIGPVPNEPIVHIGAGKVDLLAYNPNYIRDTERMTGLKHGERYDTQGRYTLSSPAQKRFYIGVRGEDSHFSVRYRGNVEEGFAGCAFKSELDENNNKKYRYVYIEHNNTMESTYHSLENEDDVYELDLSGLFISAVDLRHFINVKYIDIRDNDFITNDVELMNFATSLPDRTDRETGTITLDNVNQSRKIADVLFAKNWISDGVVPNADYAHIKTTLANSITIQIQTNESVEVVFETGGVKTKVAVNSYLPSTAIVPLANDASSKEIKIIEGFEKITKLIVYNSQITDINTFGMTELQKLHIHGNPICNNPASLDKLIQSLPDRTLKGYGSIVLDNKTQELRLEPESLKKDWCFGSMLQYNHSDKLYPYITKLNIPDIWETAEYGEGVKVCVWDTFYDTNCEEHDPTKFLPGVNFTGNGYGEAHIGKTPDDNNPHGTGVTNMIHAKGARMYGVAHKSSIIFWKFGHTATYNMYNKLKAGDYDFDIVNQSFTEPPAYKYDDILKDAYINRNVCFFGGSGNDQERVAEGQKEVPGYYRYVCCVTGINTRNDNINTESEQHDRLDVSTYSEYVYTNFAPGDYQEYFGNSFAIPIATGVAALLQNVLKKKLGRKPNSEETMKEFFKRIRPLRFTKGEVGHGIVDVAYYNPNWESYYQEFIGTYDSKETNFTVTDNGNRTYKLTLTSHNIVYGKPTDPDNSMSIVVNGDLQPHDISLYRNSSIALEWGHEDIKSITASAIPLTFVSLNRMTRLESFSAEGCSLDSVSFSTNIKLTSINLAGNPVVTNDAELTNLANSLPNRVGQLSGMLTIKNGAQARKILSILVAKNWAVDEVEPENGYAYFKTIQSTALVFYIQGTETSDIGFECSGFKITKDVNAEYLTTVNLPLLANDLAKEVKITTNIEKLKSLRINGTYVTEANLKAASNLTEVYISNNPIILNDANLTDFANSLPDRTGNTAGIVILENYAQQQKIDAILRAKNWMAL